MTESTQRDELGTRRVTDAQTLRALTHHTRLALLETLGINGPMTATEAAEHVGESPSSCSWHLRQLAKYGFVEEAGGGTGRRRPWRMSKLGLAWSNVHEDPATEVAASALSDLLRTRQLDRLEAWMRTRAAYGREWREAAVSDQYVLWLTPEELRAIASRIGDELGSLYRERLTDASLRPDGALPVETLVYGFPMTPPPDGAS